MTLFITAIIAFIIACGASATGQVNVLVGHELYPLHMIAAPFMGLLAGIGLARSHDARRLHRMRSCLKSAAEQFRTYSKNHLAKTPPDVKKAEVNMAWATVCRDASNI